MSDIYDNEFRAVCKSCPCLVSIELYRCWLLTNESFAVIAATYYSLESLEVLECKNMNLGDMDVSVVLGA